MRPRSQNKPVWLRAEPGPCTGVLCCDSAEAESISRNLVAAGDLRLFTYHRTRDFLAAPPDESVDLVIWASPHPPAFLLDLLDWVKRLWPKCVCVVTCSPGAESLERDIRQAGALFFLHPVFADAWPAVVQSARRVRASRQAATE